VLLWSKKSQLSKFDAKAGINNQRLSYCHEKPPTDVAQIASNKIDEQNVNPGFRGGPGGLIAGGGGGEEIVMVANEECGYFISNISLKCCQIEKKIFAEKAFFPSRKLFFPRENSFSTKICGRPVAPNGEVAPRSGRQ
jgi:hypothetical protein